MSTSLALTLVVGCLFGYAIEASAQIVKDPSAQRRPGWEFQVPSGVLVPTGVQRNEIKRGNLSAVQFTWVVRSALAVTTTVGWARSRDVALATRPKLDVFTYDVGAELRARPLPNASTRLMTFAGVGAGGRSYRHREDGADASHNLAGYASVGGEIALRRLRLRVDVRDYVSGFRRAGTFAANTASTRTRNDVVVMAGLRFVRR